MLDQYQQRDPFSCLEQCAGGTYTLNRRRRPMPLSAPPLRANNITVLTPPPVRPSVYIIPRPRAMFLGSANLTLYARGPKYRLGETVESLPGPESRRGAERSQGCLRTSQEPSSRWPGPTCWRQLLAQSGATTPRHDCKLVRGTSAVTTSATAVIRPSSIIYSRPTFQVLAPTNLTLYPGG